MDTIRLTKIQYRTSWILYDWIYYGTSSGFYVEKPKLHCGKSYGYTIQNSK